MAADDSLTSVLFRLFSAVRDVGAAVVEVRDAGKELKTRADTLATDGPVAWFDLAVEITRAAS